MDTIAHTYTQTHGIDSCKKRKRKEKERNNTCTDNNLLWTINLN